MRLLGLETWLLLASLALSFFLSGMEAGVFALSPARIRHWMRARRPRADILYGYLEHAENFFFTILVGNILANFVAVGLWVLFLHAHWGNQPLLAAVFFLGGVFLFYTACDLLPKMLFRAYPNRLCLSLVGGYRLVHAALQPLVRSLYWLSRWLLRWTGGRTYLGRLHSSRDELRLALQETTPALTTEERAMIQRVLDLNAVKIGQLGTPLVRAITVSAATPLAEVLRIGRETGRTRLPVWVEERGARRIGGVISLKTLLYQGEVMLERLAGDYLKPALYLPEELRVEEALRRMQRGGQRLAILLGAGQRETGVVSLEDILRFMVGEVTV